MSHWLSEINSYRENETKLNSTGLMQLATTGLDKYPKVRTVVFRGWTESQQMKIFTDKRSSKYLEIQSNNKVEVCWLFNESKCQFRFRGSATVDKSEDTLYNWNLLSERSKLMWSWRDPGMKYEKDINIQLENHKNLDYLDNFILLKIRIIHVDQLLLTNPIHTRRRWIRKKDWIEERINP